MNIVFQPIFLCAVMAAVLAITLTMFFSLKKEIAILRRDFAREKQLLLSRVEIQNASLSNLGKALHEESLRSSASASISGPTAPVPEGLPPASANLAKRSQAIRRWRRGESYEQIAQALAMPKVEVELLVKAYRASSGAPAPAEAGNTAAQGAPA